MLCRQQCTRHIRLGFTLIEILIVVVILAILASISIVAFGSASREAREAVLKEELRFMRTQISLYRATHAGPPGIDPGSGSASWETMAAQLTKFTDFSGNAVDVQDTAHCFPPYLSQFPKNPFMANNADQAKFVSSDAEIAGAVDETTGWIYCPQTLEFCANSTMYGPNGKKW